MVQHQEQLSRLKIIKINNLVIVLPALSSTVLNNDKNKSNDGEFPGCPVVQYLRTLLPIQGMKAYSLVREQIPQAMGQLIQCTTELTRHGALALQQEKGKCHN